MGEGVGETEGEGEGKVGDRQGRTFFAGWQAGNERRQGSDW